LANFWSFGVFFPDLVCFTKKIWQTWMRRSDFFRKSTKLQVVRKKRWLHK
jgi:hypothetical protein